MEAPQLVAWSVVAYSTLPLLYTLRRTSFQFLLLYAHLASLLTFGGLLGGLYRIPISGDVSLLPGQVSLAGFFFATVVTIVAGRDLQVVRNILVLTISVMVLLFAFAGLTGAALRGSDVVSPFGVPAAMFEAPLLDSVLSGLLILGELVLLLFLLERCKRLLPSWGTGVVYPLAYIAILLVDGVLVPLVVLRPESGLGEAVLDNLGAKALLAALFTVPLLVFVTFYRDTVTAYEARPLDLSHLLSLSRDDLLAELDSHKLELQEQRDRILDSTASMGRVNATVDRILDSATNTILIALDTDMHVTHFNAGAQRLLGYAAEDVCGQPMSILHSDEEISRHARVLGTPPDHRQVARVQMAVGARRDWEFVASNGSRHMVSLSLTAVEVDGLVVGHIAAGEDVTSRLRVEAAMMTALSREHDALVRLQEADRVKNELVSTVSHELRTPIASISGYTEMLYDGAYGQLSPKQVEALDRVLRNTQRLTDLVDDLLVLERVEQNTSLPLDIVPLDLKDVIRGTSEIVAEMVRGRDLKFNVALPAQPVKVHGDPAALERMVLNLISNAVKFTPGRGTITLRVVTDEAHAWLSVADTGIGVAQEDQGNLFSRFYRTSQANDLAIPGSGLGLSIVKAIVSSHEGEVSLVSAPGQGTTVTVSLPLSPVPSRTPAGV